MKKKTKLGQELIKGLREAIAITIDVPERRRQVKKDLPPALFRKLESVLTAEVKSKNRHFQKDGWDLSYPIIQGNIYQDVFGSALEYYVMGRLLEFGDQLVWDTEYSEFLLRRVAGKRRKDPIKKPKRGRK